jgi:hypothetical protein
LAEKLIARRPEVGGSVDAAGIRALLELTIGNKGWDNAADLGSLLTKLSTTINAASTLDSSTPDEVSEIVAELSEASSLDMSSMEDHGLSLLMCATSGMIPREMWFELNLEAYHALAKLIGAKTVNMLETADTKRTTWLTGAPHRTHTPSWTLGKQFARTLMLYVNRTKYPTTLRKTKHIARWYLMRQMILRTL